MRSRRRQLQPCYEGATVDEKDVVADNEQVQWSWAWWRKELSRMGVKQGPDSLFHERRKRDGSGSGRTSDVTGHHAHQHSFLLKDMWWLTFSIGYRVMKEKKMKRLSFGEDEEMVSLKHSVANIGKKGETIIRSNRKYKRQKWGENKKFFHINSGFLFEPQKMFLIKQYF